MPDPTVKVRHQRRFVVKVPKHDESPRGALQALRDAMVVPDPRNGRTIATITLRDGTVLTGVARCRSDEAFSRKRGRDIATGRVLREYYRDGHHARQAVRDDAGYGYGVNAG